MWPITNIRKAWRKRKMKKLMAQLHETLRKIDRLMKKEGWIRQERRRLWREFFKSDANRERIFDSLSEALK